jgi:hypothetical protein
MNVLSSRRVADRIALTSRRMPHACAFFKGADFGFVFCARTVGRVEAKINSGGGRPESSGPSIVVQRCAACLGPINGSTPDLHLHLFLCGIGCPKTVRDMVKFVTVLLQG